jgi:hypothetical protein
MSKVWLNPLFPTLNHNTMLTNYDVMLKSDEIKLIDNYVIQNNLPEMNFSVFKNCVCSVLPNWRAEQLISEFHHDDGGYSNYKKYINQ